MKVQITLSDKEEEFIIEQARKEDRTMAGLIRHLIEQAMRAGNPYILHGAELQRTEQMRKESK